MGHMRRTDHEEKLLTHAEVVRRKCPVILDQSRSPFRKFGLLRKAIGVSSRAMSSRCLEIVGQCDLTQNNAEGLMERYRFYADNSCLKIQPRIKPHLHALSWQPCRMPLYTANVPDGMEHITVSTK